MKEPGHKKESLKNVLIITYYWPPSGGPGVQRVLKFCKYLPEFGWNPIILTVEGGEYPALDPSLESEIDPAWKVVKTSTLEPFRLFKRLTGRSAVPTYTLSGSQKESIMSRLSRWVRFNLVVPDARIGWYPYAVRAGKKIINEDRIDVIFSSGPPHTVHLVAKKISGGTIPWVADFRDPWTDRFYYEESNRWWLAKYIDERLERKVLQNASRISVVSKGFGLLLNNRNDVSNKISVIYNGYDESDFQNCKLKNSSDSITIAHIGNLSKSQCPFILFEAINQLNNRSIGTTVRIDFFGNVHSDIKQEVINQNLNDYVNFHGYKPHKIAIKKMLEANFLLVIVPRTNKNKGIIPGKIFEYLRTGIPIILIGPLDCDAATIIINTGSGYVIDYEDYQGLMDILLTKPILSRKNYSDYSRYELTKRIGKIFNELT